MRRFLTCDTYTGPKVLCRLRVSLLVALVLVAGSVTTVFADDGAECRGTVPGRPGDGCFGWPVPSDARWISGYVFRDIRYTRHNGTDFGLWYGGPVYASDDGRVIFAGWWPGYGYGNLIIIDHLNGWETRYAHLSRVEIVRGQWVAQGDVIARGGSTGWSTGPHLHFELRWEHVPVDPMVMLP